MRIAVLGAGALGTLYAACLSRTAHEVWLSSRRPVEGVTVDGISYPAVRLGRPDRCDLLLCLVKAYDTEAAVAEAPAAAITLTLQNGWGNADLLARRYGAAAVLAGTTAQGATLLAPGRARHAGRGETRLGPWAPDGPAAAAAEAVRALLEEAGLGPVHLETDPRPSLWAKLAVSCAINPLTALHGVTNGALLTSTALRRQMEAAAREASAVAAAHGVMLSEEPAAAAVRVALATAANRSSMLQDLDRGRRTEIDAICGAIVRMGEAAGVNVDLTRRLWEAVRAREEARP
jgi:2-dehydropantoate 2-reductase